MTLLKDGEWWWSMIYQSGAAKCIQSFGRGDQLFQGQHGCPCTRETGLGTHSETAMTDGALLGQKPTNQLLHSSSPGEDWKHTRHHSTNLTRPCWTEIQSCELWWNYDMFGSLVSSPGFKPSAGFLQRVGHWPWGWSYRGRCRWSLLVWSLEGLVASNDHNRNGTKALWGLSGSTASSYVNFDEWLSGLHLSAQGARDGHISREHEPISLL